MVSRVLKKDLVIRLLNPRNVSSSSNIPPLSLTTTTTSTTSSFSNTASNTTFSISNRLLSTIIQDNNNFNKRLYSASTIGGSSKSKSIEDIYQKKTPTEHVLLRPDSYIGTIQRIEDDQWVLSNSEFNQETKKKSSSSSATPVAPFIHHIKAKYIPGLLKIFDEILVNAADNKQRDPAMSTIRVDIDADKGSISIMNDGHGIPVSIHKGEKIYVVEMVMGSLMSGSNFNDAELKVVGGRNGFGAKLTNIFSSDFKVETYDAKSKLLYSQSWKDNMGKREEPIIKSVHPMNQQEFTRITFRPDLKRFHMESLRDDDVLKLMERRVYDIAACCPDIKVYFNGQHIQYNFQSYVSLFEHHLSKHQEKNPSDTADNFVFANVGDRWKIGLATSDTGQFMQVSFVNSINTLKGGTHVNFIADQVVRYISDRLKKKYNDLEIRPMNIKHHLALFVNCLIDNPSFDSQTKETLTTKYQNFGSQPEIPEPVLAAFVKNSKILEKIAGWVLMKQQAELVHSSSTRTSKASLLKNIHKLDDANWAGGQKSKLCTLILTEGDSAKSLAVSGLGVIGRDKYGVFPLRGKLLNVRDVTPKQLLNNEEINNLTNILGLSHKKKYIDEESMADLRYGKIMIMTDQDNDGSHIKGLIINFIHYFWPELLQRDFVEEFVTPIIKVSKGSEKKAFFTMNDYHNWVKNSQSGVTKGWTIKYYKGLGTNTSAEAKEYFSNLKKHIIKFTWSGEPSSNAIAMAFNKDAVQARQRWLLSSDTTQLSVDHSIKELSFDDFINKELIHYSWAANHRSIPSVMDGLKPGQRKILYAAFKRKLTSEIKVAQFSGYVAEHTAYHHGEQSLSSTIVKMAQDFVGSNNIPLLTSGGQFGTRLQGGDDSASPRYIFTKLNSITRLIFNDLDDDLLKYLEEEGEMIQPNYYVPILPMILVNGSDGIGVGMSNSVPLYSPIDLIDYLLNLLNNQKQMKALVPWYRGFTGTIVRGSNAVNGSFKTSGVITRVGRTLVISDLPIGKWTVDYKVVLNDLVEKDFIKSYHDGNTENSVSFTIHFTNDQLEEIDEMTDNELIDKFKLNSSLHSNLMLFDTNGNIKKYESTEEIIGEFFQYRRKLYVDRKKMLQDRLKKQIDKFNVTIQFISLIASGKVKLGGKTKQLIIEELHKNKFKLAPNQNQEEMFNYLFNLPILDMTQEKIDTLTQNLSKRTEEFNFIQSQESDQLWKTDLQQLKDFLLKDKTYKRK
ncbi:DNA topoisomerase II [Cavenderia fasciculata]|uniref:DNA topoisomerase 2 n=1 Tax=Cavenderia fasciculata TaxID=261658 RepID=F4PHT8_CACFS|nr:DNA topoisomerase II [Cavenderia fasciculata]EGG25272.1 DNA topoisomerase II [Cavenderia fasciculata]|eukprot:XP_004363123.1 DNA topoisomerase II [Cavenderia fasciculata]